MTSHHENTASGFSATLFEDRTSPGNFTLAFRGTELPGDIFNDVYSADLNGIVISGAAFEQIVDLYIYWHRLTTPTTSHYVQAELITSSTPPENGYFYTYQVGHRMCRH